VLKLYRKKRVNKSLEKISATPDSPKLFGYKTIWLAVPSNDALSVVKALGRKHNAVAANWASGIEFVNNNHDYVFVSLPIKGWVYVIGLPLGSITHDKKENQKFFKFLKKMSSKLSKILYFATHRVVEFHSWLIVQDSKILRAFANNGERGKLYSEGNITDKEKELGVTFSHIDELDERYPEEEDVITLAEEGSLNPTTLVEYSEEKGGGVLIKWN
jgi:hypothetical protein